MPANEYYDSTGAPATGSPGSSSTMRAELDLIEDGFNKLPGLTGHGGQPVFINASSTAMEAKTLVEARNLMGAEEAAKKDAEDGYAGLDGYKVVIKESLGLIASTIGNENTVARDYVLPDKSGTVALTSDLPANVLPFTPSGSISASNVQAAIEEVASEAASQLASAVAANIAFTPTGTITSTNVQAAIAEVVSDLSATTVPFTPTGAVSSTNVQAAIAELDVEKASLNGPVLVSPTILANPALTDDSKKLISSEWLRNFLTGIVDLGTAMFRLPSYVEVQFSTVLYNPSGAAPAAHNVEFIRPFAAAPIVIPAIRHNDYDIPVQVWLSSCTDSVFSIRAEVKPVWVSWVAIGATAIQYR